MEGNVEATKSKEILDLRAAEIDGAWSSAAERQKEMFMAKNNGRCPSRGRQGERPAGGLTFQECQRSILHLWSSRK